MPNLLLSGPAGAGKTGMAREIIAAAALPTVAVDFQALYAAILLLQRGDDGRYAERSPADAHALPLAEYARRALITATLANEVDAVVTNSDGDEDRRARLLALLGPGQS